MVLIKSDEVKGSLVVDVNRRIEKERDGRESWRVVAWRFGKVIEL